MFDSRKEARVFSLAELLLVLAVIAVTAAFLFPVFAQARSAAHKATGISNLRQMTAALRMYDQDYDDSHLTAARDELSSARHCVTVQMARQSVHVFAGSNNLQYNGGLNGIGVERNPKVYLVLWGSQWSSDPSGEAAILQNFFNGVGGSSWMASCTQYYDNFGNAGNPTGIFGGIWRDNAGRAPKHPSQGQLAGEAVAAAAHFGNTTAASNASVQYVIATSHGNNAGGFGTQYCAWHSYTSSSYGNIAYTNLPYITDAGGSCGANFNGLGPNAGITIVEGHEMAETITDQFPSGGWTDASGAENGDKCAWISSGQGASANITLATGTFPVQSLWSNAFNGGNGGCVLSYP